VDFEGVEIDKALPARRRCRGAVVVAVRSTIGALARWMEGAESVGARLLSSLVRLGTGALPRNLDPGDGEGVQVLLPLPRRLRL
jgi:hypothetical protein